MNFFLDFCPFAPNETWCDGKIACALTDLTLNHFLVEQYKEELELITSLHRQLHSEFGNTPCSGLQSLQHPAC